MKISTRGRYATRVMVDIATSNKTFVSLAEIAERQNITVKYLEQIISKLVKAKLVVSSRGAQGGYKLAREPKDCKISEILDATGDMPELAPCDKSNYQCAIKQKCTTYSVWNSLEKMITDFLNSISLQDLINKNF